MRWIVDYENSDGELSTRELTAIGPSLFGPEHIDAFCLTRQERRSFNLNRLVRIIDPETGEIIKDPRPLLGMPAKPIPPAPPTRSVILPPAPGAKRRSQYSTEAYVGQRKSEKNALRKYYVKEPIYEHFMKLAIAQFDSRCARCGAQPSKLDLDHHWPMILGGHLSPGNIVPLCRACNMAKRDKDPADFYSVDELERIQAMLDDQRKLMAFEFEKGRWYASEASRRRYLLAIGFDPELVETMYSDPEHPWFQGERTPGPDDVRVTLTVSLEPAKFAQRPANDEPETDLTGTLKGCS